MDIRIVDGRLTKDAEVKLNKTNGTKFLSFTIANNGFAKGMQTTTYFNVISYNEFDINRVESLTKGKLVVVSGRPNETISVKENNTYLNHSIMAHNIESGTPNQMKDNTNSQTTTSATTVHQKQDVKPPVPTAPQAEIPVVATPVVTAPTAPTVASTPVSGPYQAMVNTTIPKIDDELPF